MAKNRNLDRHLSKRDRHLNKHRWFAKNLLSVCKQTDLNEGYIRVISVACISTRTDLMLTYAYPHIKKLIESALKVETAASDFTQAKDKAVAVIEDIAVIATIPNIYAKGLAVAKAVYDVISASKLVIHGIEDIAREREILIVFLDFYTKLVNECKKMRAEFNIPAGDIPTYKRNENKSTWDDISDALELLFDIYTDPKIPPPPDLPQIPNA
jgi:hypothetical protein